MCIRDSKLEAAIDLARRLVKEEGYSTNQAAKEAAGKTRQPKRVIYQALLEDA